MSKKIGVFGSTSTKEKGPPELIEKARALGKALGEQGALVITGACSGCPYLAAEAALKEGSEVWGFSPAKDREEQQEDTPTDNLDVYTKLIFIPADFEFADDKSVCYKFRNILSTATCDAGIIIAGKWGTLNEFTSLVDVGKNVGVLTGTGGTADEIEGLMRKIKKKIRGTVIFDNDPEELVRRLMQLCS